jgi:hypothetical protein
MKHIARTMHAYLVTDLMANEVLVSRHGDVPVWIRDIEDHVSSAGDHAAHG